MSRALILVVLLLCAISAAVGRAQSSGPTTAAINQVDAQGRRTGPWQLIAPQEGRSGYADGQLIEEGSYLNGKRSGPWKRYWPNGKLMSEITYHLGRPKGPYKTYFPSGKAEEQGNWDLDRNTGAFKRWHPNGELAQEFVFDQYGTRDGQQLYYHENGQLAVSVNIEQGKEDGTLKRYYANGDLQQVAEFDGGVINAANSRYIKPVHRESAVAPEPVGKAAPAVAAEERPNAVIFRENGYNTLYDKQLRLSQVGMFKNGRLYDGKRYRCDANGKLVRIEVYQDGRYAGDAVITDEDLQ